MKHAGIHWPANAGGEHPNVETILGMPGVRNGCTLICADSARYWYRQARGASPFVVWRAIPRQGKLPAQLGWEPNRVADECLNLWDEQDHGGVEWFLPLNELQFEKENGGPFPGYREMAENLARLRLQLRRKFSQKYPGSTVRLMFPAWVPTDDGDRFDEWYTEAGAWDAIALHCYGSAATMHARYLSYRSKFPHHGIFVGEWNANHEGHDEHAALSMWAEVADTDPGFLGATYYIWETRNAGEDDLSIWGNDDRFALFRNPPTVQPLPAPEPIVMTRDEVVALICKVADENGLDRAEFLGGAIAESNLDPKARRPSDPSQDQAFWPDVSFGLFQQTARFSDEGDHSPRADNIRFIEELYNDPAHASRVAAGKFKAWRSQEATALDAWCRYNWPAKDPAENPNRANYERGLAEARRILGVEHAPAPKVVYNRDTLSIPQNDPWSCAPTSTRWAMTALGRHPKEAWMEAQMLADGIVSVAQGLLDASGQQLAAWITAQYGEYGYSANAEPATFDGLAAEFLAPSNPYPGLLGGRAWGHWSGLRSYDPATDRLLLANPAEGWMGVGQTMSRDDFARLGPFSLVRVLHEDLLAPIAPVVVPASAPAPEPAPPPQDDPRALIAKIREYVDRLERAV